MFSTCVYGLRSHLKFSTHGFFGGQALLEISYFINFTKPDSIKLLFYLRADIRKKEGVNNGRFKGH